MTDRAQVEAHLEFFRELGVEGISRDPVWRRRAGEAEAAQAPPAAGARAAASSGAAPTAESAPSRDGAEPRDVAPPPASGAVALSMFDRVEVPAEGSPRERLDHVREQLGPCTRCKLHAGRTTLVFGVGNPDADLMFVGEAPGRDEDREGIPFVGRAGQLLTRIIEAIDLRRDDVYIANVIKCRPPDNRNPEPDEVQTCEPYLFAQIDCIRPRVIVALGSFAARTLLRDDRASITRVRGNVYSFRGAQLIPTFHPAFLLRSPDRKREVWEDMKLVRSLLRG